MVNAIRRDHKIQTRRLIKPQPTELVDDSNFYINPNPCIRGDSGMYESIKCPYGTIGDILWVRESFVDGEDHCWCEEDDEPRYGYRADCPEDQRNGIIWTPSIHMPKSAAREFLEVYDVKVERLHDISPEDCLNEGVEYWNVDPEYLRGGELVADFKNYTWTDKKSLDPQYQDRHFPTFSNSFDSFRTLWQSINGIESWKSNPWVWVISFERIDKPKNWPL